MKHKILQFVTVILALFFGFFAFLFLCFSESDDSDGILVGRISLCFCLMMVATFIGRRKQITSQKKLDFDGILIRTTLPHIAGLQVSDCVPCVIDVTNEAYKFKVSNIDFNLPRNKVTDVCIKTKTEVQKQYVSSFGGAAMGGALFGLAGAAYGGRAKAKSIRNITNFLVITYLGESENDIKTIIFGIDNGLTDLQIRVNKMAGVKGDMSVAKKIVKDFNNNSIKSNSVSIEL